MSLIIPLYIKEGFFVTIVKTIKWVYDTALQLRD